MRLAKFSMSRALKLLLGGVCGAWRVSSCSDNRVPENSQRAKLNTMGIGQQNNKNNGGLVHQGGQENSLPTIRSRGRKEDP